MGASGVRSGLATPLGGDGYPARASENRVAADTSSPASRSVPPKVDRICLRRCPVTSGGFARIDSSTMCCAPGDGGTRNAAIR